MTFPVIYAWGSSPSGGICRSADALSISFEGYIDMEIEIPEQESAVCSLQADIEPEIGDSDHRSDRKERRVNRC